MTDDDTPVDKETHQRSVETGKVKQRAIRSCLKRILHDQPLAPDLSSDAEHNRFDITRQRIKEIEEKARQRLRSPRDGVHCAFCAGTPDLVGSLCQADSGICICLSCAEEVISMLRSDT